MTELKIGTKLTNDENGADYTIRHIKRGVYADMTKLVSYLMTCDDGISPSVSTESFEGWTIHVDSIQETEQTNITTNENENKSIELEPLKIKHYVYVPTGTRYKLTKVVQLDEGRDEYHLKTLVDSELSDLLCFDLSEFRLLDETLPFEFWQVGDIVRGFKGKAYKLAHKLRIVDGFELIRGFGAATNPVATDNSLYTWFAIYDGATQPTIYEYDDPEILIQTHYNEHFSNETFRPAKIAAYHADINETQFGNLLIDAAFELSYLTIDKPIPDKYSGKVIELAELCLHKGTTVNLKAIEHLCRFAAPPIVLDRYFLRREL